MIDFLSDIDTQVFLAINGPHLPFLDIFMKMFTGRFIWIPMYIALAFMLWHATRNRSFIIYAIGIALAVTFADQLCATVIRPIAERLRPSNVNNWVSEYAYIIGSYRGGAYGFPSCHAANSFALAAFMSLLVRRRLFVAFIFGWAIINSYSRLYMGVHYPGDLLAGAVIGSALGAGCLMVSRRLARPWATPASITARLDQPALTIHRPTSQGIVVAFTRGVSVSACAVPMVTAAVIVIYIAISAM